MRVQYCLLYSFTECNLKIILEAKELWTASRQVLRGLRQIRHTELNTGLRTCGHKYGLTDG